MTGEPLGIPSSLRYRGRLAVALVALGLVVLQLAVVTASAATPQLPDASSSDQSAHSENGVTPKQIADYVAEPGPANSAGDEADIVARGRTLFEEGCVTCHGFDAKGVADRGPSLHGAGALAADFYLRTGRMPLAVTGEQPRRAQPAYPEDQIRALVAYVGSLGGPAIPEVHPESGDLARGLELFNLTCAGCHATTAQGGVVIGAYAPPLGQATPVEVAEAVRMGPYVMPHFSRAQINDSDLDSIVKYVMLTQDPVDKGGWGIGHIGPVPEGLVAWLIAIVALLLVARLLGERIGIKRDKSNERPGGDDNAKPS